MEPTQNRQKSQKPLIIILICLIVLICAGSYLYIQSLRNDLKSATAKQAQLEQKNEDLTTKLKIAQDAQRTKDLALFANAINDYNKANGGHLTTEGTISKQIYDAQLSKTIKEFVDPDTGKAYGYVAVAQVQSPPPVKVGVIQYQWAGKCGANGDFVDTSDVNLSAVRTLLESGSTYCLNI
jgi:hypothetical protein